jgi:hypothetical protein
MSVFSRVSHSMVSVTLVRNFDVLHLIGNSSITITALFDISYHLTI